MAKRILIVDDDANMCRTLRDILLSNSYVVRTADGGNSALKIAEAWRFDFLITDVRMPGMDGMELANKIVENYPWVRLMFMTAHTTFKNYQVAGRLGFVLTKPMDIPTLLESLKNQENLKI